MQAIQLLCIYPNTDILYFFKCACALCSYNVKKVSGFQVPSRDVTNQTLPAWPEINWCDSVRITSSWLTGTQPFTCLRGDQRHPHLMEYVLVFGYFHTAAFQPYIYDSIDAGGWVGGRKNILGCFSLWIKQEAWILILCEWIWLERFLVTAIQKTYTVKLRYMHCYHNSNNGSICWLLFWYSNRQHLNIIFILQYH